MNKQVYFVERKAKGQAGVFVQQFQRVATMELLGVTADGYASILSHKESEPFKVGKHWVIVG